MFLGSLIYGRFGERISHYKIIFASLITSGVILVIFSISLQNYPYFFLAAVLSLLLGVFVAPMMIASNTIVHDASDNAMMGKTFSSLEILMHLGFFIFMFVSSSLAEKFSSATVLVAVGVLFAIVGIYSLIWHRNIAWLTK